MPKLMIRIIMCMGAVLLSTTPISQTFAQVKQQESQASGIAVADSSSATESDNLQLLRPGATAIFPVADSTATFESAATVPAAAISTAGWVGIGVLTVAGVLGCRLTHNHLYRLQPQLKCPHELKPSQVAGNLLILGADCFAGACSDFLVRMLNEQPPPPTYCVRLHPICVRLVGAFPNIEHGSYYVARM